MKSFWLQSFRLPPPKLTEKTCPDQEGRIFIVTGGYAGVGFELSKILHAHNATVYIAGRSATKADKAMTAISTANPHSKGKLAFMNLDLSNLSTIKPAVQDFLSKEDSLHVLVNNAGVMVPPKDSKDSQGEDLQIGTNCVGPYLLYKLLTPILTETASKNPPGSIRVAWAGSLGVEVISPKPNGMDLDTEGRPRDRGVKANYGQSKVGNLFFAEELARKTPENKIVHVSFNPGNLKTELQRHVSTVEEIMTRGMLYPAIYGSYTELFAAVSPEVTPEKSGAYIWPWGRFGGYRQDISQAMKATAEGGTGVAVKFVAWCDQQVAPYM